jgi:hypothetical protein
LKPKGASDYRGQWELSASEVSFFGSIRTTMSRGTYTGSVGGNARMNRMKRRMATSDAEIDAAISQARL